MYKISWLMWNSSTCDSECDGTFKIVNIHVIFYVSLCFIKNCTCKKCLFDKLVLACDNEILDTTKTSIVDKKVTYEKNCLIHTISLLMICLLLLVFILFSCYHYYGK